ncbi:MAG: 4'-phosphopantetheinyl transferase superfamily protein [Candidatus Methylacidiphilaceae bacterium]
MASLPGPIQVHLFTARLSAFSLDEKEGSNLPGRIQSRRSEALLRRLLSRFAGVPPQAVPLWKNRWGKPLLPASCGLWFSLSHSGDRWIAAVARFPVGIDLEAVRPRKDPLRLARRFLLPEEAAVVSASSREEQLSAFLRIWTKKEAFLKGCGSGLFRSPCSFRFTRREGASSWENVIPSEADGEVWKVQSQDFEDGFLGALAVAHSRPEELAVTREEFPASG